MASVSGGGKTRRVKDTRIGPCWEKGARSAEAALEFVSLAGALSPLRVARRRLRDDMQRWPWRSSYGGTRRVRTRFAEAAIYRQSGVAIEAIGYAPTSLIVRAGHPMPERGASPWEDSSTYPLVSSTHTHTVLPKRPKLVYSHSGIPRELMLTTDVIWLSSRSGSRAQLAGGNAQEQTFERDRCSDPAALCIVSPENRFRLAATLTKSSLKQMVAEVAASQLSR